MDLLGSPSNTLLGFTSNPGYVTSSPGGVGRNIADNLSRLQQPCWLMAPLGDDANGRFMQQHCQQLGIETQALSMQKGQSTSTYVSIVDEHGEMQVAIADMALIDHFGEVQLKPHLDHLNSAALVVIDTNLSAECLRYLCAALPNKKLFVDTVSVAKAVRIKPHLQQIHSLKPNLAEAQAIADTDYGSTPTDAQLSTLAHWFTQQGVRHLYLSLGARGVLYSGPKQQFLMAIAEPQKAPIIINSNGAGDAMMAALCAGWIQGLDAPDRVAYGLACAQIAMSSQTTINPQLSPQLVQRMLKEYPCQMTPLCSPSM
jgi:pseudouridine kinase